MKFLNKKLNPVIANLLACFTERFASKESRVKQSQFKTASYLAVTNKIILFSVFVLLVNKNLNSQSNDEIFTMVEEQAEFPGGIVAMQKYLRDSTKYPEKAKKAGISGKCFLKFVVNETGDISNIEVLKGVPGCPECDREGIRVVRSMPKWKPAKMTGRAVKVYFNLPINFKLDTSRTKRSDNVISNTQEATISFNREAAKIQSDDKIYTIVEQAPEFPGGTAALSKYIRDNTQYPSSAKEAGVGGRCFLKFVVNETGDIGNIEVSKGIQGCPDCDQEAIRVVKSMPRWSPGKQSGKPVKVYYNLPFNFQTK